MGLPKEILSAHFITRNFLTVVHICYLLRGDLEEISSGLSIPHFILIFSSKPALSQTSFYLVFEDFKKLEDGIVELVNLINSGSLIIGQNIKEFDLSVLSNHGASPSSDLGYF